MIVPLAFWQLSRQLFRIPGWRISVTGQSFGQSKISCSQESDAGISKSKSFQAKQAAKLQTNFQRGLAETLQETI
jgi:hypothetical protein